MIGYRRGSRLEIDWVNFDEKRDEWHVKFIDNPCSLLISSLEIWPDVWK